MLPRIPRVPRSLALIIVAAVGGCAGAAKGPDGSVAADPDDEIPPAADAALPTSARRDAAPTSFDVGAEVNSGAPDLGAAEAPAVVIDTAAEVPPVADAAMARTPDGPSAADADARGAAAFGCPPDPSLRACYTFDEGAGVAVHDSTKFGNHGTLTGGTWVAGVSGKAIRFGNVKDIVLVPDAPSLRIPAEVTLEAWIRATSIPTDRGSDIVVGKYLKPGMGYLLSTWHGEIAGSTGPHDPGSGGKVSVGVWSHIATTLAADAVRLFQDGAEIAHFAPLKVNVNEAPLTIGQWTGIPAGESPEWFQFLGDIDEVRVYARARKPAEICADANRTWTGSACH